MAVVLPLKWKSSGKINQQESTDEFELAAIKVKGSLTNAVAAGEIALSGGAGEKFALRAHAGDAGTIFAIKNSGGTDRFEIDEAGNVSLVSGHLIWDTDKLDIYTSANARNHLNLYTGDHSSGISGGLTIKTGSGTTYSGSMEITTGAVTTNESGYIFISTGAATGSAASGQIDIISGNTVNGNSGSIDIDTGQATGAGTAGIIRIGTLRAVSITLGRSGAASDVANFEINLENNTPVEIIRQTADETDAWTEWKRTAATAYTVGWYTYNGTPESNVTANIGSQCVDRSSGTLYYKTTSSTNTGWVAYSHGVATWTNAATVTADDIVRISANNTVAEAQANSAVNARAAGWAIAVVGGNVIVVSTPGSIIPSPTIAGGIPSAGIPVYLHPTISGTLTIIPPTTSGQVKLRIGFMANASDVLFMPGEPVNIT
jgi:hypothetical protein